MRRQKAKRESVLVTLGRAIRESDWVQDVVWQIRKWLVQLGPERARRYLVWLLLIFLAGEVWMALSTNDPRKKMQFYSVIHAASLGQAKDRARPVASFGSVWDRLMADTEIRRKWDSLVKGRPGLLDTVNQLKRMDSAEWVR